jgi:hypothetical protein
MALSSNNISFLSFGKTAVGGIGYTYTLHNHTQLPLVLNFLYDAENIILYLERVSPVFACFGNNFLL